MAESQHARDYERAVTPHKDAASFTDEDVERVAEAIYQADPLGPSVRSTGDQSVYTRLARAALSAYLEPTTKKET